MRGHERGFYILNGSRRALAAREAGRKTIPAVLYREGHRPRVYSRLRLAGLYSPKATIERDARYYLITPPIREPIEVEAFRPSRHKGAVPLSRVRLV